MPETLQRVRQWLDAEFEDAIFHGHCTNNPAAAIRRKMRETMPRDEAGESRPCPIARRPRSWSDYTRQMGIAGLSSPSVDAGRPADSQRTPWLGSSAVGLDPTGLVVAFGDEHCDAGGVLLVARCTFFPLQRNHRFWSPATVSAMRSVHASAAMAASALRCCSYSFAPAVDRWSSGWRTPGLVAIVTCPWLFGPIIPGRRLGWGWGDAAA